MAGADATARLFKLSGAGNDFLAQVVATGGSPPARERVVALCRRALSVGADGLFTLERLDADGATPGARMVHFNADGGRAELCLNGSRCAIELAAHLGWVEDGASLRLETDSGPVVGTRVAPGRVRLELPGEMTGGTVETPSLEVDDDSYSCAWLRVGGPHAVLSWNELAAAPVTTLGARLRAHPDLGPAGANVHFCHWLDAQTVHMRSFERGVEGETLACGSGAVAVALAASAAGSDLAARPVSAHTAGGFVLTVGRTPPTTAGGAGVVTLEGDARLVASIELRPGALDLPTPPPWASHARS